MTLRELCSTKCLVDWSAKSCQYKTEIIPACHVPSSWIATSDANRYSILKYIFFEKFRQSVTLFYKIISSTS